MNNYLKVVIGRTALLIALVLVAAGFIFAVGADQSDGGLLDEEGVLDRDTLDIRRSE